MNSDATREGGDRVFFNADFNPKYTYVCKIEHLGTIREKKRQKTTNNFKEKEANVV